MGVLVVSDQRIRHLLGTRKQIESQAPSKKSSGHVQVTSLVSDSEGNRFRLYLRLNHKPGMSDDFSCGLSYVESKGETFTLVRYNGPSHNHRNKLERIQLGYVCHIHTASQRYMKIGKADGYAEATDRFHNLPGAFLCLSLDCNIDIVNSKAPKGQSTIFDKQ